MAAHHRWWNDVFLNLYFDDRLWAHMIRGAEWLCVVDRTKIQDASLLSLLHMGVLNWKAPNNHLHQATQAIRHGVIVMIFWYVNSERTYFFSNFLNFILHLGLITTPHVLYVHMIYVYSFFLMFHFSHDHMAKRSHYRIMIFSTLEY